MPKPNDACRRLGTSGSGLRWANPFSAPPKNLLDKAETIWIASVLSNEPSTLMLTAELPLGVCSQEQTQMNWSRQVVAISRRVLLQLAAVGSTAAFLTPNATAAFGASMPPGLPSVETSPGAIDAYVSKTQFSGIATLLEIQEEYRRVIPIFPLVLPVNWSFPDDPGLGTPDPKILWERGNGVVAAYLIWQSAIVTEAYEGHKRGDSEQKGHYLNILEAAYATAVRKAVILDDDNVFIEGAKATKHAAASRSPLQAAREGDFAPIRALLGLN